MKFWDASALVPVCIAQPETATVKALLDEDPQIVVWWNTIVECWSALARLRRAGALSANDEEAAYELLGALQESWNEIIPGDGVHARAGRLLRLHPMRSAEALETAAAPAWAGDPPTGEIVVYDKRLREAARLEGLLPRPEISAGP
jgi:hypothetical protein